MNKYEFDHLIRQAVKDANNDVYDENTGLALQFVAQAWRDRNNLSKCKASLHCALIYFKQTTILK